MNYSSSGTGAVMPALQHLSEETIDLYACHRLSDEALNIAEQHLLICEHCQRRQQEADDFNRLLKAAPVAAQQARSDLEKKIAARARRLGAGWWLVPAFAMLGFVIYQSRPLEQPPAELTLLAMRGESPSASNAPAGRTLLLRLDLTGLEAAAPLRVELADANGQTQASADARLEGGQAVVRLPGVAAGSHWVRLFRGQTLVREYALPVGP